MNIPQSTANIEIAVSYDDQPQNIIENKPEEMIIENNDPLAEPSSEMKVQTRNDEKMNVGKNVVRNVVREDDDCDWGARGCCRTHCLMGKKDDK